MKITGTVSVACPVCGAASDHPLIQTVNARDDADNFAKLLRGELNVATCACGKLTQLAADFVFHDPDAQLVVHVCPDGEAAMQRAEAAFASSYGAEGQGEQRIDQRIVPSMNALVEKVKISQSGLRDWAVEMLKVLLLASLSIEDDDRVLLFSHLDRDANAIRWLLFDPYGEDPTSMSSPLAAYERLLSTTAGSPAPDHRRIDRAWAIDAVRAMIASGN